MGDRCNVGFITGRGTPPIYLYSHWGGKYMPIKVQKALKVAQPRWNDSYGCRIMISQIIGDQWNQEYGFGISHEIEDNEYPLIYVSFPIRSVLLTQFDFKARTKGSDINAWSFEDFLKIEDLSWNTLMCSGLE